MAGKWVDNKRGAGETQDFKRKMHPPWRDAGRGRNATSHAQLMCECCGFCMTVGVHDASRHTQLQSRAENRCPVMLFSQTAGMGAGRVARSDAYAFLQQRGWGSVEIVELLDHLDADSAGNVDKETLVRAHDAMIGRDGNRRGVGAALAIIQNDHVFVLQMKVHLVPPKNAHSPQSWHEQACLHLGLRGTVRLCFEGVALYVGLSLQGRQDDLLAYLDGLMHANVSGAYPHVTGRGSLHTRTRLRAHLREKLVHRISHLMRS